MTEQPEKPKDRTSMVRVCGVWRSFGSQVVLEDISFELAGGRALCICGANAAGKTTLLRVLAGLLAADEGQVKICGFDVRREAQKARAKLGVISHRNMVYPQLTVVENLRFFARLYGIRDGKTRIPELLKDAGLMSYRCDRAGILSRGMMRRLAIVRALVHRPSVLLADEPFDGLDTGAGGHFVDMLNGFTEKGGAVVMTTHNVGLALRCCDRVAVLNGHKLVFDAKVGDIDAGEFAKDYLSYAGVCS